MKPNQPRSADGRHDEADSHLSLNLHREFFVAILTGKKKTEYRENTVYWRKRLAGRIYREIHFRNGYATKAPFMRVECLGIRRPSGTQGGVFAIRLGRVLERKYCTKMA
jgi:hypothetical protein